MEALTGVNVALLTIYDMCKAIDKGMVISDVHLVKNLVERVEISTLTKRNSNTIIYLKAGMKYVR